MKKYPKIGIRPTIDGRQGGVRESLEDKTMNLAKAVAELISSNLKNGDGSPVECVIADSTIGRVAESAACAEKFEREGADGICCCLMKKKGILFRYLRHISFQKKKY